MVSTFLILTTANIDFENHSHHTIFPLDFDLYNNLQPSTRATINVHQITNIYKLEGRNGNKQTRFLLQT